MDLLISPFNEINHSQSFQIRTLAVATKMSVTPMPLTSDGQGNVQTGNNIVTGKLVIRNRVTAWPECFGTFIDLQVDKKQRWSEIYLDARPCKSFPFGKVSLFLQKSKPFSFERESRFSFGRLSLFSSEE